MELKRRDARLFEVDAAKFFAIIFMICVHVYERFGSFDFDSVIPDTPYRNIVEFLGGPLAAPVFMFCMGIGMIYTRHSEPADFIKRGIKLLIMGYALNFFRQTVPMFIAMALDIDTGFSLIGGLLNVDILPFSGMAFIIIGIMKKLKVPTLGMLGVAVIFQAAGIWATKLDIESVAIATLIGLLLPGGGHVAFPMTLWLIYPVLGMLFGEVLKKAEDRAPIYRRLMIASTILFAALSVALKYSGYDLRLIYTLYHGSYYNQTILSVLWIIPLVMLALSANFFILGGLEETLAGRFIRHCSSNLTCIYVTQWILIGYGFGVTMLLGIEKTQEPFPLVLGGLALMAVSILIMTIYKKIQGKIRRIYKWTVNDD